MIIQSFSSVKFDIYDTAEQEMQAAHCWKWEETQLLSLGCYIRTASLCQEFCWHQAKGCRRSCPPPRHPMWIHSYQQPPPEWIGPLCIKQRIKAAKSRSCANAFDNLYVTNLARISSISSVFNFSQVLTF